MNLSSKVLLILLLGIHAQAAWNSQEREYSASYSIPFKNPYAASVWRVASYPWYTTRDFPEYKKLLLKLEAGQGQLYIRTGTFVHRDAQGNPEKRPLFVFLPGIFANLIGATSLMHGYFFYQKGYNVLMLSNPWSPNWIVDNPVKPMGNVDYEVDTVKKIIALFKTKIPVTTTSLYGYSYGAFLAARLAATSGETYENIFMVGPPMNLMGSMYRLDSLADESYSQISNTMSMTWLGLSYMNANSEDQLRTDSLARAKAIAVYGGFVESLAESILTYGYRHNENYEPPNLEPAARRAWLRNWRFRDYVKKFLPNLDSLVAEDRGLFIKWVDGASKRSKSLRVLTASDDFINASEELTPYLNDSRFMILPNGGHCGYLNTHWYWNLLEKLYGNGTPAVVFPDISSPQQPSAKSTH